MHPIERLRHVARAEGAAPSVLAAEAAHALRALGDDPAAMVTACRRLLERHPAVGPLWWLSARVLAAGDDGAAEIGRAVAEIEADPTARLLADVLPDDATVVVVGWPEVASDALRRRGDVEALVVDSRYDARGLVGRLTAEGGVAAELDDAGAGPGAATADLVLVEALAMGPDTLVARIGSRAVASVARSAGRPVWAVAGVGRVLPGRLWLALAQALDATNVEPWDRDVEVVPLELVDQVACPGGLIAPQAAASRPSCAPVAELLRGFSE